MLNSPVLRIEPLHEQTLLVRPDQIDTDYGSQSASNFLDSRNLWVANDAQSEISKINRAAKALLTEYAILLRPVIRTGLIAQTNVICDADDWDDEDLLPSLDSYRCMLKGLIELAPMSRPNLSVSDNGNIIAGWFSDSARTVFEFLPNERISWVISRTESEENNRAVGVEPISKIRAIAIAHDAILGED